MFFEKEKNIVRLNLDNNKTYTIDINNGILYGVRGTPIKTLSYRSAIAAELKCVGPCANYSLRTMLASLFGYSNIAEILEEYAFNLQLADRLDSLGITCYVGCQTFSALEQRTINKYLAPYLAFIRENNYKFTLSNYSVHNLFAFAKERESEKRYSTLCGQYQHQISLERFVKMCSIFEHYNNFSDEEMRAALATASACKLFDYADLLGQNEPIYQLARYLNYCRVLGVPPKKLTNFTREYTETALSYKAYKAKYNNEILNRNYQKYSQAWKFTFENCVVLAPTCAQDIVIEGQKMHHCVGCYVDDVVDNKTYICFIRHADKPEEPYITCEVKTNGEIGQYFLAHDRRISSAEDKRFYQAFQDYLHQIWNEEDAVI